VVPVPSPDQLKCRGTITKRGDTKIDQKFADQNYNQKTVAARTQPSRPMTLKSPRLRPRTKLPRTGCLEAKDRKVRGQSQGLEDTFENTRKYKCKNCNYDFTGIQA